MIFDPNNGIFFCPEHMYAELLDPTCRTPAQDPCCSKISSHLSRCHGLTTQTVQRLHAHLHSGLDMIDFEFLQPYRSETAVPMVALPHISLESAYQCPDIACKQIAPSVDVMKRHIKSRHACSETSYIAPFCQVIGNRKNCHRIRVFPPAGSAGGQPDPTLDADAQMFLSLTNQGERHFTFSLVNAQLGGRFTSSFYQYLGWSSHLANGCDMLWTAQMADLSNQGSNTPWIYQAGTYAVELWDELEPLLDDDRTHEFRRILQG